MVSLPAVSWRTTVSSSPAIKVISSIDSTANCRLTPFSVTRYSLSVATSNVSSPSVPRTVRCVPSTVIWSSIDHGETANSSRDSRGSIESRWPRPDRRGRRESGCILMAAIADVPKGGDPAGSFPPSRHTIHFDWSAQKSPRFCTGGCKLGTEQERSARHRLGYLAVLRGEQPCTRRQSARSAYPEPHHPSNRLNANRAV